MNQPGLRVAVSVGAAAIIVVRVIWPDINIDAITLGLLALLVLPWLSPLIKSAELPGGWKVEFRDLQEAAATITAQATGITATGAAWPTASNAQSVVAFESDPNLALVAIRIEIERRLRRRAETTDIAVDQPISHLIDELHRKNVFTSGEHGGLRIIVRAGNKAAHGASVDPEAANWARTYGQDILDFLDKKLAA